MSSNYQYSRAIATSVREFRLRHTLLLLFLFRGAPCQDITEVARRNTKADFPIAAGKKPGRETATRCEFVSHGASISNIKTKSK